MEQRRLVSRTLLFVSTTCIALLGHFPTWPLRHSVALAQVPPLIRYQGQAVDSNGVPLEGPYALTFRLYQTETGGTAAWTERQDNVQLLSGHFSVLLGQVTPLSGMDWSLPCWLSVQVNEEPELAPRQRITSVPLALRAETAEQLSVPVTTSTITDDANRLMPTGGIILWDGVSCPAGYVRVSTYDDKFLLGAATAGTSGGSATHAHGPGTYAGPSHTHTVPATQAVWGMTAASSADNGKMNTLGGYGRATIDASTSASGTGAVTGTSASTDSRPPFLSILLCKKN